MCERRGAVLISVNGRLREVAWQPGNLIIYALMRRSMDPSEAVVMSRDDTFSAIMSQIQAGDEDAATVVFRRFADRLRSLARSRLETMSRSFADAEDVIQSVYKSFFARYAQGQYQIDGWNDLWGLLAVITLRKCANRRSFLTAHRRDARREVSISGQAGPERFEWQLADREPTPLEAAMLADTVQKLLCGFDVPDRATVSMLLQGYSEHEIASAVTCSERTVRRVRSRLKFKLGQLYDEAGASRTG